MAERGHIAGSLIHQLHTRGVAVIATVRDAAKAKAKLPAGVQAMQVDFKDAASVKRAVQSSGAKRAYVIPAAAGNEALEAMKAGGLTHVVLVSTNTLGQPTELTALQTWGTTIESAIKAAGFTYTYLRCEGFMSNGRLSQTHTFVNAARYPLTHSPTVMSSYHSLLHSRTVCSHCLPSHCTAFRWRQQIDTKGRVALSHPDVAARFVAFDDIATVAATALTTNQYDNQTVTIQGTTPITERQQLQLISQRLGKPIEVATVSEAEFKQSTTTPAHAVDSALIAFRFRQERGAEWQVPTDAVVTGPTTFENFLARNIHEFTD